MFTLAGLIVLALAALWVMLLRERALRARLLVAENKDRDALEQRVSQRTAELEDTAQRLALSEDHLRGILESASDGILTTDAAQIIVAANAASARMFGCTVENLIGRPLDQLIPERSRSEHRRQVDRFGAGTERSRTMAAQPLGREVTAVRLDGEEFPIEASISHTLVAGERLYTVIHRDLSEQRRVAAEVLAREQLLAATFDASTVPMAQIDPVTRRLAAVNHALCSLSGYAEAELLGMGPDDLNHPDDRLAPPIFDALLRGEAAYRETKRIVRKDGAAIWVEVSGSVVRAADGQALRLVALVQDISARLVAEGALRAREARLAFLVRLNDRLQELDDPQSIAHEASCLLGDFAHAERVGYAEDSGDGETMTVACSFVRDVPGIEGRYRYADYGTRLLTDLREGRTVVRPDVAHDPTLNDEEKAAHAVLQLGATVNVPLRHDSQLDAVFFVHAAAPRSWTDDELRLFEDVALRIRADIARARAQQDLAKSHATLQHLVASLHRAQEDERKRIARELHDDLQQSLAAIRMDAVAAGERVAAGRRDAQLLLTRIERLSGAALESTRRIVSGLRPEMLEELGLLPALEALCADHARHWGLECRFETCGVGEAAHVNGPALETGLYRIAQEALNNVGKHAQASVVKVELDCAHNGLVILRVIDNGIGMRADGVRDPASFGLLGMAERVRVLGGQLSINACAGEGTVVEVSVPTMAPAADPVTAQGTTPAAWTERFDPALEALEDLRGRPLQAVIDALDGNVAVLDRQGVIHWVNRAWREFAARHGDSGLRGCGPGVAYLDVCRRSAPVDANARSVLEGLSAVLDRRDDAFVIEYPCDTPEARLWFRMHAAPINGAWTMVSHVEINPPPTST